MEWKSKEMVNSGSKGITTNRDGDSARLLGVSKNWMSL